jgi:hypothetical protein
MKYCYRMNKRNQVKLLTLNLFKINFNITLLACYMPRLSPLILL